MAELHGSKNVPTIDGSDLTVAEVSISMFEAMNGSMDIEE